jgi:hypothetical protein
MLPNLFDMMLKPHRFCDMQDSQDVHLTLKSRPRHDAQPHRMPDITSSERIRVSSDINLKVISSRHTNTIVTQISGSTSIASSTNPTAANHPGTTHYASSNTTTAAQISGSNHIASSTNPTAAHHPGTTHNASSTTTTAAPTSGTTRRVPADTRFDTPNLCACDDLRSPFSCDDAPTTVRSCPPPSFFNGVSTLTTGCESPSSSDTQGHLCDSIRLFSSSASGVIIFLSSKGRLQLGCCA